MSDFSDSINNNLLVYNQDSPEVKCLRMSDIYLEKLILRLESVQLNIRNNHFSSLTKIIISQQLSSVVANTIWNRTLAYCGSINPAMISSVDIEELKSLGISSAKANYIKGIADYCMNKETNLRDITRFTNGEIINILTGLKGIGRWSAEMFLIFSLGRLNVLPYNDAGLHSAIRWLYKIENSLTLNDYKKYDYRWDPYQSLAALYLWKAVDYGIANEGHNLW